MSAPKRIYLQLGEEYRLGDPLPDCGEATWSLFHEFDTDIEYLLGTEYDYDRLAERVEKLHKALRSHCIGHCATPDDPKWYCWQCDAEWPGHDVCDERHAPDCLARPTDVAPCSIRTEGTRQHATDSAEREGIADKMNRSYKPAINPLNPS